MTIKGKIGVLIESHFDETEYRRFGEFFPERGYAVEYISRLWGQPSLTFEGNDMTAKVVVDVDVSSVSPSDYAGIIMIGGYAMDRLRYEESVEKGRPNHSPAVSFLRQAIVQMEADRLSVGAICHGLWLLCAAPDQMKGRMVTCAHNILCDVESAGGIPVYNGDQLVDVHSDRNLITGRHPGVVEEFMEVFCDALDRRPLGIARFS